MLVKYKERTTKALVTCRQEDLRHRWGFTINNMLKSWVSLSCNIAIEGIASAINNIAIKIIKSSHNPTKKGRWRA